MGVVLEVADESDLLRIIMFNNLQNRLRQNLCDMRENKQLTHSNTFKYLRFIFLESG